VVAIRYFLLRGCPRRGRSVPIESIINRINSDLANDLATSFENGRHDRQNFDGAVPAPTVPDQAQEEALLSPPRLSPPRWNADEGTQAAERALSEHW
jgi:methionyl-tRNA synthetase